MKYSEKFVWESVGKILPAIIQARNDGVKFNLPKCLKMAAAECWLISDNTDFKLDFAKQTAGHVIKVALLELQERGMISFGERDYL